MCASWYQGCLAFPLKFLNYLQTFMGLSIIVYSICMLEQCCHHETEHLASWFTYLSMGLGILLCLIAFTGHIAVAATNGCCLCFYAVLISVLIVLEAAFLCDLLFNEHWEEDLPYDPTGELKRLRAFIEDDIDLCRWVAVTVVAIQALSLLLAMILRVIVLPRMVDYDADKDLVGIRKPLLNPQGGADLASTSIDNKGIPTDTRSSQMRLKYGLHQVQLMQHSVDPKASMMTNHRSEEQTQFF